MRRWTILLVVVLVAITLGYRFADADRRVGNQITAPREEGAAGEPIESDPRMDQAIASGERSVALNGPMQRDARSQDQSPSVRFDPSAWPPLPAVTDTVATHIDAMRARSEQGDLGASCWLGMELLHCARLAESHGTQAAGLPKEADSQAASGYTGKTAPELKVRLAALTRCGGALPREPRETADWLMQAARGGSKAALATVLVHGPDIAPGFPDGDLTREILDDREAMIWAALSGGTFDVVQMLRMESMSGSLRNWRPAHQARLEPRERQSLAYLLRSMEYIRAGMLGWDAERAFGSRKVLGASLDDRVRGRLDQKAHEFVAASGPNDRQLLGLVGHVDPRFPSDRCAEFAAPIERGLTLSQALKR